MELVNLAHNEIARGKHDLATTSRGRAREATRYGKAKEKNGREDISIDTRVSPQSVACHWQTTATTIQEGYASFPGADYYIIAPFVGKELQTTSPPLRLSRRVPILVYQTREGVNAAAFSSGAGYVLVRFESYHDHSKPSCSSFRMIRSGSIAVFSSVDLKPVGSFSCSTVNFLWRRRLG
jgi:hypothetical protein